MRISDWSSDVCSSDLVGRDDQVRPKPCRKGLHEYVGSLGLAASAGRIADGPAHRIARRNRRDGFARLQGNIGDTFRRSIKPVESTVSIGRALDGADEAGGRRHWKYGLVGGGYLRGGRCGGGNGEGDGARRQGHVLAQSSVFS